MDMHHQLYVTIASSAFSETEYARVPTTVLLYFLAVVCTVISHQQDNPDIWNSSVQYLYIFTSRESLCTPPSSPTLSRLRRFSRIPLRAPQPVHPLPQQLRTGDVLMEPDIGTVMAQRVHPPPQVPIARAEPMELPHINTLREAQVIPLRVDPLIDQSSHVPTLPAPVLQPLPSHFVDGTPAGRRGLPSTIVYANQAGAMQAEPSVLFSNSEGSPLGDWPRQDIMKQPVKRKHKLPSQVESTAVGVDRTAANKRSDVPPLAQQTRAIRPPGPRGRAPLGDLRS